MIKARLLGAVAVILFAMASAEAGTVVIDRTFSTPVPFPQFGLAFDPSSNTLFGIANAGLTGPIVEFDLDGNALRTITLLPQHNSIGVAVKPGQAIYYWQNTGRSLRTADYLSGVTVDTDIIEPFGLQTYVGSIAYDAVTASLILPIAGSNPPLGIFAGFDFVTPGTSTVASFVPFDFETEADIALIFGLVATGDSYYVLGQRSSSGGDHIVRIDRTTLHVLDAYDLGTPSQTYHGLALDPATGHFYTTRWETGAQEIHLVARETTIPEPASLLLLGAGAAVLLAGRRRRRPGR